ncbi:hypothetical protein [Nocardioides sp. TF02-7]|uniref:hypothetical protein n=1 Tax=Nocardioides sp. TF02-7 TaxID=2917724 RepID=UPI001F050A5B|nr:hypothetical protein [Nocardioides sp. TF02-7]UMG92842.1 hypothetical protein MF408_00130 [Nocardioides sp. TF02-7]
MAMPDSGVVRAKVLLKRLEDFVVRMQGDLHDQFNADRAISPDYLAELILAKALVEDDTPFCVYNLEPSGRVWFFYRLRRFASWHPDAPRPNAGEH